MKLPVKDYESNDNDHAFRECSICSDTNLAIKIAGNNWPISPSNITSIRANESIAKISTYPILLPGDSTWADVLRLDPLFQNGWLSPPTYMPILASDLSRLAGMLAYSAFIANIELDHVYLERAIKMEDELKSVNSQ